MTTVPNKQIRAAFDHQAVRVYQAYSHAIADSALEHQTFVSPPFKSQRMTWIKPSFLWMMYRSGWATKDPGQARILAIDITRTGFEWALVNSCLSDEANRLGREAARRLMAAKPVRVQWDPERDLQLRPLDHRTIQIGLSGEAVRRYTTQWIVSISEVTDLARSIHDVVTSGGLVRAQSLLPHEAPYPIATELAARIGADDPTDR